MRPANISEKGTARKEASDQMLHNRTKPIFRPQVSWSLQSFRSPPNRLDLSRVADLRRTISTLRDFPRPIRPEAVKEADASSKLTHYADAGGRLEHHLLDRDSHSYVGIA